MKTSSHRSIWKLPQRYTFWLLHSDDSLGQSSISNARWGFFYCEGSRKDIEFHGPDRLTHHSHTDTQTTPRVSVENYSTRGLKPSGTKSVCPVRCLYQCLRGPEGGMKVRTDSPNRTLSPSLWSNCPKRKDRRREEEERGRTEERREKRN